MIQPTVSYLFALAPSLERYSRRYTEFDGRVVVRFSFPDVRLARTLALAVQGTGLDARYAGGVERGRIVDVTGFTGDVRS